VGGATRLEGARLLEILELEIDLAPERALSEPERTTGVSMTCGRMRRSAAAQSNITITPSSVYNRLILR
jgi:hypothetical protein